ncbi:hypothetical protein ACJZ2D_013155 [Fusarium nematophilum]
MMDNKTTDVANAPHTIAQHPTIVTRGAVENYLFGGGRLPNAPTSDFLHRLEWVWAHIEPRYQPDETGTYQMSSSLPDQEDAQIGFADQPPPSPECYANKPMFFGNKDDGAASVCRLETLSSAVFAQEPIDSTHSVPSSPIGFASQPEPTNPNVPSITVTPPPDSIGSEHGNAQATQPEHDRPSDG